MAEFKVDIDLPIDEVEEFNEAFERSSDIASELADAFSRVIIRNNKDCKIIINMMDGKKDEN